MEQLSPALTFLQRVWSLEHALERASLRMERALGITAQQRFVVRVLGARPGTRPAELAELLHVDRGSVTALLRRLEAQGWVARRPDAHDGRSVRLSLTAAGKKRDVPAALSVEQAVADVLARTSEADQKAVVRVLTRLVSALDALEA